MTNTKKIIAEGSGWRVVESLVNDGPSNLFHDLLIETNDGADALGVPVWTIAAEINLMHNGRPVAAFTGDDIGRYWAGMRVPESPGSDYANGEMKGAPDEIFTLFYVVAELLLGTARRHPRPPTPGWALPEKP